jgi:hypothetical protein
MIANSMPQVRTSLLTAAIASGKLVVKRMVSRSRGYATAFEASWLAKKERLITGSG